MKKYVHHIKAKPEHVRKRVAIGAAAGITALIAIVWIVTLSGSGALALSQDASPIDKANSQNPQLATGGTKSTVEQLLGAVGAAGATSSAPALTIVDGQSNSTFQQPAPNSNNATVLPF